ncbi:MAG TPA: hypothetical protein VHX38_17445 [Pseudonocardiaceae bacterium]|jgi:hypothetical protein|nr:hypothetical protein [Pseudonocardiaceae bacterium]
MTVLYDASVVQELVKLIELATIVINEHTDVDGLCAVCGSAWPCERVVFAEHNIELL